MIIDILYAFGMILFFLAIGMPVVRIALGTIDAMKLFIAILTGLAMTIICGSWLAAMSIDLVWLIPVLATGASIAYAYIFLTGQKLGRIGLREEFGSIKKFAVYLSTIIASGASYIVLQNDQLIRGRLSFLAGPDLASWVSSAKYLCGKQSIAHLSNSIRSQLGIPNVLLAFRDAAKYPLTSIDRIPSFTEQADAEFLVGAHRYGIPAMQAGVCKIVGVNSLYFSTVALMAISGILVAILATLIMKDVALRMDLKIVAIFLCAVNVNIVSVAMEGGFGQLIATPFLLFCLVTAMKVEWREKYFPFAVFLFVAFALSTYIDVMFAAVLFLWVFYIVQSTQRRALRTAVPKWVSRAVYGVAIGLIAGWPLWTSFPRLAIAEVKGAGSLGGWDQGRIPFPTDFWGLFNWLPSNGVNNIPRGLSLGIVELLISLIILYICARSRQRIIRNYVITGFLVYLILMILVYKGGTAGANNYSIWKMSAYLSSFTILALASIGDLKITFRNVDSRIRSVKMKSHIFASLMLVLALLAIIGWSVSWIGSRQYSFLPATSKEQAFFNKYDVQMSGFPGGNTTKFILQGNVHYVEPSRAVGVTTERSVPPRPLAYVVPSNSCQTVTCLEAETGPITVPLASQVDKVAPRENKIVNGDFKFWSYGASFNQPGEIANNWLWATNNVGTVNRERFTKGETLAPSVSSHFYLRWTIDGDSYDYEIYQKVRPVQTFNGRTVALSFWARQTEGSTTFQTRIFQDFCKGAATSPSCLIEAAGSNAVPSLTTSWKRFIELYTIPKIAGTRTERNKASFLWVSFQASNTAAGQLDLAQVQLVPIGELKLEKVYSSNAFNAYVWTDS